MFELPTTLEVCGRQFHIRADGDYRMVIDCFIALRDVELSEDHRVLASLLIFYNEFNSLYDIPQDEELVVGLVKAMYNFMNLGEAEVVGANSEYSVIDWKQDEKMIVSAVNKVAGKEVRAEHYMHWWTFMGYYMAVGESLLSTVVSIRSKIAKHEKLEKWEEKFKKDNPTYFIWTNSDMRIAESQALLSEIWNVGR